MHHLQILNRQDKDDSQPEERGRDQRKEEGKGKRVREGLQLQFFGPEAFQSYASSGAFCIN